MGNLNKPDPCAGPPIANLPRGFWRATTNIPERRDDCLESTPILLVTSKENVDEHKVYRVESDNSLTLLSTNAFNTSGDNDGIGSTTGYRLGDVHFLILSGAPVGQELQRSRDNGVTWEAIEGHIPGIDFDLSFYTVDAGGRIWAVGDIGEAPSGIYFSDDEGDSWELSAEGQVGVLNFGDQTTSDFSAFGIVAHPDDENIIVVHGYSSSSIPQDIGIAYTTDRGSSWQSFIIEGTEPLFLFIEVKQGIFTDSGRFVLLEQDVNSFEMRAFWTDDISLGLGGIHQVLVEPAIHTDYGNPTLSLTYDGGVIFGVGNTTNAEVTDFTVIIWRSDNEGESWQQVTLPPLEQLYDHIVSLFYDAEFDRLLVITAGAFITESGDAHSKVWVSSPPGENWTDITPEDDLTWMGQMLIWR